MKAGNLSFAADKAESARSVDTDYFDKGIMKILRNMVRYLLKTGLFPEFEKDDLMQKLSIELWNAQKNYNKNKSNKYTFAECVLKSRAKNLIDAAARIKEDGPDEFVPLDVVINENGDEYGDTICSDDAEMSLGNRVRSEINRRDLIDSENYVISQLPKESQRICYAFMEGETISSLAKAYGISRTAFRKRYVRPIRLVCTKMGLDEFIKLA